MAWFTACIIGVVFVLALSIDDSSSMTNRLSEKEEPLKV
jgi:hypothetical protein